MRFASGRSADDRKDPAGGRADAPLWSIADADAGVRIVLAVASRARVAGAAVASALSVRRGEVAVIALWENGEADVEPVAPAT
ncbi:MAG: hypothetical protein ITG02_12110, partial [Patulibacter sp.]|nr:hypothetical protein [Patulibacter sp.]